MKENSFIPPGNITTSAVWEGMLAVVRKLKEHGHQAYLVGGGVRDLLLHKSPKDLDITTDATPDEITAIFDHSIPLGASFGIITAVIDSIPYEIATFREEREYSDGRHPETVLYTKDPALDVIRRDFTINALLYDPERQVVIDHVGGIDDLKKGILRTVGDPVQRFSEDHLRMLRAIRFAARMNCEIQPDTWQAICQLSDKVSSVSQERISNELEKMLLDRNRERAFRLMADCGLLKVVLPEINVMRGVTQPVQFHPEGDVFEHTMLMLSHIAVPTPALVWSVLLHDVAKPVTRTVKEDGIPHFYGHEAIGADMAETILKRLRLPRMLIDSVVPAVRNHMRFACIDKMKPAKWKRIIADPNFSVELELHRIDCISCHGLLNNYLLMLDRMRKMELEMEQESRSSALPPPFLNGKDLIALGMKPGMAMGILLREISDMQLENQLTSREEALAFARAKIFSSL